MSAWIQEYISRVYQEPVVGLPADPLQQKSLTQLQPDAVKNDTFYCAEDTELVQARFQSPLEFPFEFGGPF